MAGHRFAVVIPDNHLIWNEMKPYEPFVVDDESQLVFSAEMIDTMPDTTGKQRVLVSNERPEMARIELYEWNGMWLLEIAPTLDAPVRTYLIADKAFTKAQFRVLGSLRFSIGTVMMLMFAFSTARKNTLLMHSSVTVKDGKGYLFLGTSGTGKSTHSQLWINTIEGCELLNDDNPVLRVGDDGTVRVYGSPWSGKTPCYRNASAPVAAFVRIVQAPENRLTRCTPVQAYAQLYSSSSGLKGEDGLFDAFHETLERVVGAVPGYVMECRADREAAEVCSEGIRRDREKRAK